MLRKYAVKYLLHCTDNNLHVLYKIGKLSPNSYQPNSLLIMKTIEEFDSLDNFQGNYSTNLTFYLVSLPASIYIPDNYA